VTYGTTTSVFHLAKWQCVIRYHDQRISRDTKGEGSTPSSDEVYFFSDLGKLCDFLRIQLFKDDIEIFFLNQKAKIAICTKRENVIGANRRHFYQVVSV
jgi:hypothetical protein